MVLESWQEPEPVAQLMMLKAVTSPCHFFNDKESNISELLMG